MAAMQPPSPRLRQIACVLHAALIGLGAAATGGADALRGHDAMRYGAVLAAGVLSVLHVLDPKWPVPRRATTAWAAGLLVLVTAGSALGVNAGLHRLGIVILASWCLACALNAAAMVSMVGSRPAGEGQVVSFRVAAALFIGVLGWAAGVRVGKVEALLPAVLAIVAIGSLVTGASRLEASVRSRAERTSPISAALVLSGAWLAVAAIGVASFTLSAIDVRAQFTAELPPDWPLASHKARFGWFHAVPLVAAALIVFLGRFGLAGLGLKRIGGPWFSVALGGAVFVAGTRYGLPATFRFVPAGGAAGPEKAVATQRPAAVPPPRTSAPLEPSTSAPAPGSPAPSASAAAEIGAPDPSAPDTSGSELIHIESLTANGILEKDARGGLLRRMNLLEECATKSDLSAPGTLSARLSIDENGSVPTLRITGGDLVGTPFAVCVMKAFYRTGFASGNASAFIELTLRATPPR